MINDTRTTWLGWDVQCTQRWTFKVGYIVSDKVAHVYSQVKNEKILKCQIFTFTSMSILWSMINAMIICADLMSYDSFLLDAWLCRDQPLPWASRRSFFVQSISSAALASLSARSSISTMILSDSVGVSSNTLRRLLTTTCTASVCGLQGEMKRSYDFTVFFRLLHAFFTS